jgi:REP-associated tyrosine transposase
LPINRQFAKKPRMPRKARIDAPGALHHIICRGINRQLIYQDDHDRDGFVDRLSAILTDSGTICLAWALIPNHFHLLLKTGHMPIAGVMRRLLTGHAVCYNRRHGRHGHLFQNRYKSILCQEDAYLLALVRYIHLNPLRAGMLDSLEALDEYRYSGHSRLMGRVVDHWQAVEDVLSLFGKRLDTCRRRYRNFVQKGIAMGKQAELTGGGLVRSAGGWQALKTLRKRGAHLKSDERILGERGFVEKVLEQRGEHLDRQYTLEAAGYDLEKIIERVGALLEMSTDAILQPSKRPRCVQARSLVCYWAVRELGINGTDVGRRLGLSQSAVSRAVPRGQAMAEEAHYSLEDRNT